MLSFELKFNNDTTYTRILASFNCVSSLYGLTYKIKPEDDKSDSHIIIEVDNFQSSPLGLNEESDQHFSVFDLMTSPDFPNHDIEQLHKGGLKFLSKHRAEISLDGKNFTHIQKPKPKPDKKSLFFSGKQKSTSDVDGSFLSIDLTKPAIQVKIGNKQTNILLSETVAACIAESAAESQISMILVESNIDSSVTLDKESELSMIETLSLIFSNAKDRLLDDES